jgi:hypothetical protein
MSYKSGRDHHRAKLPTDAVIDMRHRRQKLGQSFRQIAAVHNCSMWTVRDIVEYRTRVLS